MADRWTDELLNDMRGKGDPPADAVIARVFEDREVHEVRTLLRVLVENDEAPPDDLPPEVLAYLRQTGTVQTGEIAAGQELFAEHGPLILMCLGCYALPAAYAAKNGVKVLHDTSYVEKRPTKRLFETAQMIIDVMTPGGLGPDGRGVRACQKVRLMHATVRRMILCDTDHPWDTEKYGVPINQEDLAGTLMTFYWIILDGLHKLGVRPPAETEQAYLESWRAVGTLMGVDAALIPDTVAESEELTTLIQDRQIGPSEEGRLMTAALLEMMERNVPDAFDGFPAALMRHFLPADVATQLGDPSRVSWKKKNGVTSC